MSDEKKAWTAEEEQRFEEICESCDGRDYLVEYNEHYRAMNTKAKLRVRQYTAVKRTMKAKIKPGTHRDLIRQHLKDIDVYTLKTDEVLIDYAVRLMEA